MNSDLTLILSGSDQQSADALAELTDWSRAGLVTDFVWMDVSKSSPIEAGLDPAAALVSAGSMSPVGLLEVLGAERRQTLRVVIAQPLAGAVDVDEEMLSQSRQVLDLTRQVLPSQFTDSDDALTELLHVLLTIPTTAAKDVSFERAIPAWANAAVVAPEMRKAPDTVPGYVTHENLAGHAALHLAAVGCLLQGQTEGVLDGHLRDAGSGEPGTVVMLRVFARSLISSDVADSLTDIVVEIAAGRREPPLSARSGTKPSLRDHYLVQRAFADLVAFDDSSLSSHPQTADTTPEKRRAGLQAFADVGRFTLDALLMLPRVLWHLLVRGAEHGATAATYGRAGTTEVRFRAADGGALESGANMLIQSVIQQNASRIAEAKDRRTAVPTPALWNRFRDVSFGLVDGKRPPGSPLGPEEGPPEVLRDRESLVLRVEDHLVLSPAVVEALGAQSAAPLTPADPIGAKATVELLSRLSEYVTAALSQKDTGDAEHTGSDRHAPRRSQVAELRDRLPEPLQSRIDKVPLEELREPLDADLERSEAYLTRLHASLHGQLLAHTAEALARAESSVEQLEAGATRPAGFNADGVRRMRRAYLLVSYVSIAAWLGWLAWSAWTVPERHTWDWVIQYPLVRGGAAVVFLIAVMIVLYFQSHSAFQRKVTLLRHDLAASGARCAASIADLSRLLDAYIQLRDWSEIVARTVYEPFGRAPLPPQDGLDLDDNPPALPTTFVVELEPSRQPNRAEEVAAAESVVRPGWLTEEFARLTDLAGEPLGMTGAQLLEEADRDVPSAPNRLREHLVEQMRSGGIQSKATQDLRDRLGLLVGRLADARHAMGTPSGSTDPLQGPPTAFALFDFSAIGQARRAFLPRTVRWWGPGGYPDPSLVATALPRVVEGGRTTDMEVRADLTRHLLSEHLALFAGGHQAEPEFVADPDSPF